MIIGKYALESITTGMYVNPFDVIREYIQNATDAIDDAIASGCLLTKDALITITIDTLDKQLTISDSGSGIPCGKAVSILTDIGNSEKHHTCNRGFRGIGRLSGLSYANSLRFRTSACGESKGTEVVFDAKRLRELLVRSEVTTLTAESAVEEICAIDTFPVTENSHFFTVILDGVSPDSGLLDEERVSDYLHQTAPVEFEHSSFSWASVISQEIPTSTYPIFLCTANGKHQIFKPYTDSLLINKTTGEKDQISDIHFTTLTNIDDTELGVAWYSISNFKGSIVDRATRGLRIRVGNILVGDGHSLDQMFKDSRFNGWVVGEIYVDNPDLILNARRDDFEHNGTYYRLEEQLRTIAVEITQKIRSASIARNKALSVALKKVDKVSELVEEELSHPLISPGAKGKLTLQVSELRTELSNIRVKQNEASLRSDAIDRLDALTGRIKGTTQFRAINLISGLTSTEKSFLSKLCRSLLDSYPAGDAQKCIDMILGTYSKQV